MRRRPPRTTRTDTSFPTRRSSDLSPVLALQELDIAHRRAVYGALDDHPAFVAVRALVHLPGAARSEEHTSELQSLMRISYAVLCLNTKRRDRDTSAVYDIWRVHLG